MDTRKYDILAILENRKNAKSAYERDLADKALSRIKSESREVEEIRQNLVMATRNNDLHAVGRFRQQLMMIRANETYGKDY